MHSNYGPPSRPPQPPRRFDGPPPIVQVIRRGDGLIVAKCPYCGKKHVHGASGAGGHRASHCVGLQTPGYVLELVDE